MTVYDLKPRFQALLMPLTNRLHAIGITANAVTVTAVIGSLLYGAVMALAPMSGWPYLLLPLFMLFRMALNAIDGILARQHRQESRLGAILNELGDVVSDAFLYVPFAFLPSVQAELILMVVFCSALTEFAGVMGQVVGAGRRYDGPMGKSDRALVFGILGFLIGSDMPILPYLNSILLGVLVLLGWTVLNRVRSAIHG
jgi:CDP-diacylglycerol--glycerol-3-phosphate 3-phosphatidyltransferase